MVSGAKRIQKWLCKAGQMKDKGGKVEHCLET
jgi:hypothetical protein